MTYCKMHRERGRLVAASSLAMSLAVLACAVAGAAYAADAQPAMRPFYVGGTAGAAVIVPNDYDVDTNRDGDGRVSLGVFAGAQLGTLPIGSGWPIGLELGYQDIARHDITYRVPGPNTRLRASGHATWAAARVAWPATARFSLYGKLGASRNSVTSSTIAGPAVIDVNGSRTGLLAAFGVQYDLASGLSVRGEATSFGRSSPNSDAAAINFGALYRF